MKKKKTSLKKTGKNTITFQMCSFVVIHTLLICTLVPREENRLEKANKQINSNQTHSFKFLLSEIMIAICTALCFCLSETSVLVSFGEVDRMNSHSVKP